MVSLYFFGFTLFNANTFIEYRKHIYASVVLQLAVLFCSMILFVFVCYFSHDILKHYFFRKYFFIYIFMLYCYNSIFTFIQLTSVNFISDHYTIPYAGNTSLDTHDGGTTTSRVWTSCK